MVVTCERLGNWDFPSQPAEKFDLTDKEMADSRVNGAAKALVCHRNGKLLLIHRTCVQCVYGCECWFHVRVLLLHVCVYVCVYTAKTE